MTLRRFLSTLGPGFITGAADDDPSGISTYSIAGASFGFAPLWTALFTFPLMAAVQLMCARLGMVTGLGLAGLIRRRYPLWVGWTTCGMLVMANTINIAADLRGMADATSLVSGIPPIVGVPLYAVSIAVVLVWTSYRTIARIFRWLTLVLGAYVITAFLVRVNWLTVLRATIVPHVRLTHDFLAVLVGLFGTTISPYLFFWQADQEVEEERAMGRTFSQRRGATKQELADSRIDVFTGMFASNLIMYFIILTTAATLHAAGHTNIASAQDAAEALRPLAGAGAYWLFTLGIIGTGMLAVPVLAGSCAYVIAEVARWKEGSLAMRPRRARKFYGVIGLAMWFGIALDYMRFNTIRLLFVTAVINGVLAPPLVLLVVLLSRNREVMGEFANARVLTILGWITFATMALAALGLLL